MVLPHFPLEFSLSHAIPRTCLPPHCARVTSLRRHISSKQALSFAVVSTTVEFAHIALTSPFRSGNGIFSTLWSLRPQESGSRPWRIQTKGWCGRSTGASVRRRCAIPCTPSIESDEEEIYSEDERIEDSSTGSSNSREPWIFRLRTKVFELPKTEKTWTVPWTSFTIIQVMFLWFCTFWLVGSWIIPLAAHYVGCSKDTLTYRGQALYSLITDIAEGTVGLCILHRCLARFKPLPRDWFPINWRGQWYIDVLLGCLMFPVVNRLSQINIELLPFPSPLISSYEKSIMARDPIASVLYAIVVSVCCPIWEEVIFRGFLLPSLTRYLPMWASILVSALVFGMAHFNVQRMLPLTFLGLVMGIMFVRSRNLLSSMLLHSLWNGFVFIGLLR